jgi:hypothetical protein
MSELHYINNYLDEGYRLQNFGAKWELRKTESYKKVRVIEVADSIIREMELSGAYCLKSNTRSYEFIKKS